jgi:hypothetical protein
MLSKIVIEIDVNADPALKFNSDPALDPDPDTK